MKNFPKTGLLTGSGFLVSSLLLSLAISACQPPGQGNQPHQQTSRKKGETPKGETPPAPQSPGRPDATPYLGLRKSQAIELATSRGLKHRIVSEDGESFRITKDMRPDRLNLTIEHQRVTGASFY